MHCSKSSSNPEKIDPQYVIPVALHGNAARYRCPVQATRGNNMKQAAIVKKIGDILYKNGLMAIVTGLYIGIYSANLDSLNI